MLFQLWTKRPTVRRVTSISSGMKIHHLKTALRYFANCVLSPFLTTPLISRPRPLPSSGSKRTRNTRRSRAASGKNGQYPHVWFLARTFSFDGGAHAIRCTRLRCSDQRTIDRWFKKTQWHVFLNKGKLAAPSNFADVANAVLEFVSFPVRGNSAANLGRASWSPSGQWFSARLNT